MLFKVCSNITVTSLQKKGSTLGTPHGTQRALQRPINPLSGVSFQLRGKIPQRAPRRGVPRRVHSHARECSAQRQRLGCFQWTTRTRETTGKRKGVREDTAQANGNGAGAALREEKRRGAGLTGKRKGVRARTPPRQTTKTRARRGGRARLKKKTKA